MPEIGAVEGRVEFGGILRLALAILSLGAGIVHLSAVGDHRDHALLAAFFVVSGSLQLVWAGLAAARPSRRVLVAGALANIAFVVIWLVSRTSGLPHVPGATAPEAIGVKDVVCVLFELLLVAGLGLLLAMPEAARRAAVRALVGERTLALVGASVLALLVPAVLVGHAHGGLQEHLHGSLAVQGASADEHAGHGSAAAPTHAAHATGGAADGQLAGSHADHADHGAPGGSTTAAADSHAGHAAHAPDASGNADASAAHDHAHPTPAGGGIAHDHAATTGCTPTVEQQAAADKLIADTRSALARWSDQNQALADGYVPYPPVPAGWGQHYLNYGNLDDGHILDPTRPEALFYAPTDEGYRPISALYILPHAGDPAPDLGGCLTHWHTHPELFLSRPGENGSPLMLHVFTVPMKGGPFAHDPDPQSVRELWTPWRVLVNPWWQDGCMGAPWLPGDPYRAVPSCQAHA